MRKIVVEADFTLEELVGYLDRTPEVEGFLTTREWASHFNVRDERMRELLRAAQRAGVLEVAHSTRMAIDGVMRPAPIYRIQKPA